MEAQLYTIMQKNYSSITEKKKKHDLRLINLSLLAHFKELQNHFEVYFLLMIFR